MAGCHHHAGAADRSSFGTARHCENSRAVRSNWKFCCLMHAVPHVPKEKDNRQGLRPFQARNLLVTNSVDPVRNEERHVREVQPCADR